MATKVSAEIVLNDSTGIANVWSSHPDMIIGKDASKLTLEGYQDGIETVQEFNKQIADARHALSGLINKRDDAAGTLNGFNTRALSAIRANFGPDSTEYDQAGGVRTSERKRPVRKAEAVK